MNVNNRPKKLSLSSLFESGAATSSSHSSAVVPDTPSTLGYESVTGTPRGIHHTPTNSFRESFAGNGRPPGIPTVGDYKITVEESLGGTDMLSARTMLKTSLAEKMELRQSVRELQEEVEFLRSKGGRSPLMTNGNSSSSSMRGGPSPRVGFIGGPSPAHSLSSSSSLFRIATGQSRGGGASAVRSFSSSQNSYNGGAYSSAVGNTELASSVVSEYKVSIKQYRRQKSLYFRAVVYSMVLKQLRRGFRTWSTWLRDLRRHINRFTRYQVTTRLLDDTARQLREMVFLKWKYSLQTLRKYDSRTFQAIRVYLHRRRKWRFWTKWQVLCARRRQIKRSICRRFRFARRVKTREAFHKWRNNARRLAVQQLAVYDRFHCSTVLVKLLFRFNIRRRIKASWIKWKLGVQVSKATLALQSHLLRQLTRVYYRKLSLTAKAFAQWRCVVVVHVPRAQVQLSRALNIVLSRVFTPAVLGAFLHWRRGVWYDRQQRRVDMVSAAAASIARQSALARKPITDFMDRRHYLFYVRAPFLQAVAKRISRGSVSTAFTWWHMWSRTESYRLALRARVRARLTRVVSRTSQGRLQRGFSVWLATVRRDIQRQLEGRLDQTGLSHDKKHEQYLEVLAKAQHMEERTKREKQEHEALLQNSKAQLMRMKHMLGKLTIRRVFMRQLSDAMHLWVHNTTLMRLLERSHQLGHERLHFNNKRHAAKFFVKLRADICSADVRVHVARAFLHWCQSVHMLNRRHQLARLALSRMMHRKTCYAFLKWREFVVDFHRRMQETVASTRILSRVGLRMVKKHLGRALQDWRRGAERLTRNRHKLRALFRICEKLTLRSCFKRLRESILHTVASLRTRVQATQVLLEDSRYDHRIDVRHNSKKLVFRLWKQCVRTARVCRSSHMAVLTASHYMVGMRNAWIRWRHVWALRRRLRWQIGRLRTSHKSLSFSHWKTVTMASMSLSSDVTAEAMNVSVGAVRASADKLSQDNVQLVRKLKANVQLVQKLMADMRGIIQIQDHNRLVRRVYLAWKRLAFVNYQNRRNVGVIMARSALINQCSGIIMTAAWEHWCMLFSIRRHRHAHALYMRRLCFNSWKLLHYHNRLQRHSVLKSGNQDNRSRLFHAFCSWKFGTYVARKRQFTWIDKLLDKKGRNVAMLLHAKQRSLRAIWGQWQHFVAVRKEVSFLVGRKVTLVKSSLFFRWRRVARNRRRIRRAVAVMTRNLRQQRSTTLHRELSYAWRRWHEFLSLRVRITVLSTWDQCRDNQRTVATRQFIRLLQSVVLTSRHYHMSIAWARWRERVHRQRVVTGLLQHRCISLHSVFSFDSSVLHSTTAVMQSALMYRRFRLVILRRAMLQWRVVRLNSVRRDVQKKFHVKMLGRCCVLLAQSRLRVSVGRWRRIAADIRLHRRLLVTCSNEREKNIKLVSHFNDVYMQLVQARVRICVEQFLRDCKKLEIVATPPPPPPAAPAAPVAADASDSKSVNSWGADSVKGASETDTKAKAETDSIHMRTPASALSDLACRLREAVITGVFESQLSKLLQQRYHVQIVGIGLGLGLTAGFGESDGDAFSDRSQLAHQYSTITDGTDFRSGPDPECRANLLRCLKSRVWHAVVTDSGGGAAAVQSVFVPVFYHNKTEARATPCVVAVLQLTRRVQENENENGGGKRNGSRENKRTASMAVRSHGRVGEQSHSHSHGASYAASEFIITGASQHQQHQHQHQHQWSSQQPPDASDTPFMEEDPLGDNNTNASCAELYCDDLVTPLLAVANLLYPTIADTVGEIKYDEEGERDRDHCPPTSERTTTSLSASNGASNRHMYFSYEFVSLLTTLSTTVVDVLGVGLGICVGIGHTPSTDQFTAPEDSKPVNDDCRCGVDDGGGNRSIGSCSSSMWLLARRHYDLLLRNNDNYLVHVTQCVQLDASMRLQQDDTAKLRLIMANTDLVQKQLTVKLSEAVQKYKAARTRTKEIEARLAHANAECDAERSRTAELSRTIGEQETLRQSRAQSNQQWGDLLDVLQEAVAGGGGGGRGGCDPEATARISTAGAALSPALAGGVFSSENGGRSSDTDTRRNTPFQRPERMEGTTTTSTTTTADAWTAATELAGVRLHHYHHQQQIESDSGDNDESPAARNASIAALNNSHSPGGRYKTLRGSPNSVKQFRRHRGPNGSSNRNNSSSRALGISDLL